MGERFLDLTRGIFNVPIFWNSLSQPAYMSGGIEAVDQRIQLV
jgi:hypothetical protein